MRAAVVRRPGPPDVLRVEDVPVPKCETNEVLVRVAACGVSSRDIVERNGTYRRDVSYPLIMGIEISGTVTEVGSNVSGLARGDHVCTKAFASCGKCRLCRSGRESTCFYRKPVRGGYGEYAALDVDSVVKVPAGIPFDHSCTLGPAAGVALNAVRDCARVSPGDTVLVAGASGGVGSPSVQIAHVAGGRVIALTRQESKSDVLRADGADEVVVMGGRGGGPDDVVRRIQDVTDGWGVDVVIDTVGSRVFDVCFASLAVHGRYALVGQLGPERITINPARIFFKRAQLIGVGSVSRSQLMDVIQLVSEAKLRVRISKVFSLDDVAQAHAVVEASVGSGRVVLHPGQRSEGETS